jgi:hypothetical protein
MGADMHVYVACGSAKTSIVTTLNTEVQFIDVVTAGLDIYATEELYEFY